VLSLGEQQLFAAMRLILAAPQFAFLDRPQTMLLRRRARAEAGRHVVVDDDAGLKKGSRVPGFKGSSR
jgi:hypothetical protein